MIHKGNMGVPPACAGLARAEVLSIRVTWGPSVCTESACLQIYHSLQMQYSGMAGKGQVHMGNKVVPIVRKPHVHVHTWPTHSMQGWGVGQVGVMKVGKHAEHTHHTQIIY